jgi:hypothetical protein
MRSIFETALAASALILAGAAAAPQSHGGGAHAAPPMHYSHPAATRSMPVSHAPVPQRAAPDQFHPAASPHTAVREYTPTTQRNVRVTNRQAYTNVSNYHINKYHTTVNTAYAAHPGSDHGQWVNADGTRWYNGYWHDYWKNEEWTNWGGHYGFWLNLDGVNDFVYEYSPGVCWYWNGYEWGPWYNPPYTPYECPY